MQLSGIPILLLVIAIGIFAVAIFVWFYNLALNYRRRSIEGGVPKLPLTEKVKAAFSSNDPSTRSPAGSIAERQQVIEDMLRGKEDQPG